MKKLFIIFFLYTNVSLSLEVGCNFEEVYTSGEIQNGILLFKNKNMRYEYFENELYTLIHKNNSFYLIHNFNTDIVEKINKNTDIIQNINDIIQDYPLIRDTYETNNLKITIEKNSSNFIKRIGVQSSENNLSINFFNCSFMPIDDKYFKHFNFVKYNKKND